MKKLFLSILLIGILIAPSFAAKQFTLDSIENINGYIQFNPTQSVNKEIKYYPMVIRFQAQAVGNDIRYDVGNFLVLGQPKDTPYTPKELYKFLKNKINPKVANQFKDIYLQGINADPSVE
ncbi:MAG TPA: hypothetical protein ENH85_01185 [Candidatus Scalindua sp.]|nr:hypothetical protein [Candidatus Scalindua sp.]